MGCDITVCVEICKDGKWLIDWDLDVLDSRCYDFYAWLGDIRNSSKVKPQFADRGTPANSPSYWIMNEKEDHYHFGQSFFTLDELKNIDFEKKIEVQRGKNTETLSLKEFLPEYFFDDIEKIKTKHSDIDPKNIRLVFAFDD